MFIVEILEETDYKCGQRDCLFEFNFEELDVHDLVDYLRSKSDEKRGDIEREWEW